MDEGYIKIHRKIRNWQWYRDSNTLHVFMDLLLEANYEDSKVGLQEIKRGQVLTSLKRISENTGLSFQNIRTALSKLEKSGEINKQITNKHSIITINKYNDYQETNKQLTNNQQTTNNIKEYKEEKEYINIKEKIYKKEKFGSFENVLLTEEEYNKLKERYPDYQEKIENLSSYIASKGAKYKSHYATIINWSKKDDKNIPEWFNKKPTERIRTEDEERELQELIRGNQR